MTITFYANTSQLLQVYHSLYVLKEQLLNIWSNIHLATPLKVFVRFHCLKGWRTTLYYWSPFLCMLIYGFTTSIHWLIHWFYLNLSISMFRDGCTSTDSTFAMYILQQQMQLRDCITFKNIYMNDNKARITLTSLVSTIVQKLEPVSRQRLAVAHKHNSELLQWNVLQK